ncbi:uncharacterized protein E0L32_001308 [Thyridium curvatum]|uniref:Glycosyl transferase CAP10 domain-containing protein n=1 Tax=Thyridium curvatum TaxID=1093900 RepID=A0A507AZ31_9PEZI|nr:uncharacterized protein E0L32_001308 [Thyridium curvatum]TPX10111.1 hypothetical protein E0L32_001308 [Thyridium curvatum]
MYNFYSNKLRFGNARAAVRFGFVAVLLTIVVSSLLLFRAPTGTLRRLRTSLPFGKPSIAPSKYPPAYYEELLQQNPTSFRPHPIDHLIDDARRVQDSLLARQSRDVASAAARYREKRGRHPPPGFDKWVEYALSHNSVLVEHFFDRIYQDIAPFWARDPKETALRAATWHHVVRVRNGKAEGVGNVEGRVPWLALWTDLVKEAAKWLPDVDMPINYMDESRLLVPWDEINQYATEEHQKRRITSLEQTMTKSKGLKALDKEIGDKAAYDPEWIKSDSPRYWDLARVACPAGSPGRDVPAMTDFSGTPEIPADYKPSYAYQGYVKNFTASTDPCIQPHLRGMHGTFIEPITMSTTKELIPLFGGCKLPMNNEILIPGAMYITQDPFYSGGETHGPPWEEKEVGVVWRGVGSGGRNKAENWRRFQRHRLIEMLNGTTVTNIEKHNGQAQTFEMAPLAKYDYPRRREGTIGTWLSNHTDTGFNDLNCFPRDSNCTYLAPYFSEKPSVPMAQQYVQKFIPDADGNSFSARFRGLLLSTSLPLKATIYSEWHDDRLLPWLHFAPLDNSFQDLHAVLNYFTADERGDAAARYIAEMGKAWGERVLRREDMLLYTWRVLLEFARVCDEDRDRLGYIDDLKNTTG